MKRNKKKILRVFFSNIICFIFYNVVCEAHYASDTDMFLENILSGALGNTTTAHGWLNIFSGKFIEICYQMMPGISWYVVLQMICVFGSLSVISYIIISRNSKWAAYVGTSIILMFLGYECYARISYVKTAAVCAGAAMVLYYQFIRRRKEKCMVGTIVLLILSMMWSYEITIIAVVINGIQVVCQWLNSYREEEHKERKKLICSAILLVLTIGMITVLQIGSNWYVSRIEPWESYIEYQEDYQWLENHGWPQYEEHVTEFEAMGISENTYNMVKDNQIISDYLISLETLTQIKSMVEKQKFGLEYILEFTRSYPVHFLETGLFLGFLVLVCFCYITKGKISHSICIFISVWCVYFLRFLQRTDGDANMSTAIWVIACIALVCGIERIELPNRELEKYYAFLMAVVMLIIINNQYSAISYRISENTVKYYNNMATLVSEDKSSIYVFEDISQLEVNLPYYSSEKGMYENCYIADSRYRMFNPTVVYVEGIIDNSQIKFVSKGYAKRVARYFTEQFGCTLKVVRDENIEEMDIYIIQEKKENKH